MATLDLSGPIGRRRAKVWATAYDADLDAGFEPSRLFRLDGSAAHLPRLDRPCIYMVTNGFVVNYVGKTVALERRFQSHLMNQHRRDHWIYAGVVPLATCVPALELDRLENFATAVLRPLETQRTPHVRLMA